ncbi:hypothetical protein BTVI_01189 [Pitangus sulphuratus]|nr:hypothetical protein BTVI_01189 [Pitangus sulphuratus]
MGQKKSKFSGPMSGCKIPQDIPQTEEKFGVKMSNHKEKSQNIHQGEGRVKNEFAVKLLDIPQDSPLGIMITYWNDYPSREGKLRETMVHYCMEVWGGRQIRQDHLNWPIYGAFEDWICQALSIYVNCKEPFNTEESEYASLWIRSDTRDHFFPLRGKKGQKNMCGLPPPYILPTPLSILPSPCYNSARDGHRDILIPTTPTKSTPLYLDEAQEYVKSFSPAKVRDSAILPPFSAHVCEPATPSLVSAQAQDSATPSLVSAQAQDSATQSLVSAQAQDSATQSLVSDQARDSATQSLVSAQAWDSVILSPVSAQARESVILSTPPKELEPPPTTEAQNSGTLAIPQPSKWEPPAPTTSSFIQQAQLYP